jgi:hypothetical protein
LCTVCPCENLCSFTIKKVGNLREYMTLITVSDEGTLFQCKIIVTRENRDVENMKMTWMDKRFSSRVMILKWYRS